MSNGTHRRFVAAVSQRKGRVAAVSIAVVAAVVAVAGGAQAAGNPGIPDESVTSSDVKNHSLEAYDLSVGAYNLLRTPARDTIQSWNTKDGSLAEVDLNAAVRAKLNNMPAQGPAGPQGPQGPAGPAGPPGPAGNDAIVSVTAVTTLSDRPDSGVHGTWADDQLTRTVSVTRQHRAEAGQCQDADQCWFYTASLSDQGSFLTREGANSPEAGTPINGQVAGNVVGGSKIEFYASSDQPNPGLVPATVTGSAHPTSEWVTLFFPAGTKFRQTGNLINWKWTYTAPQTCEVWVNKFDDNTGDITGTNAC